jgi:hypothetical protein
MPRLFLSHESLRHGVPADKNEPFPFPEKPILQGDLIFPGRSLLFSRFMTFNGEMGNCGICMSVGSPVFGPTDLRRTILRMAYAPGTVSSQLPLVSQFAETHPVD